MIQYIVGGGLAYTGFLGLCYTGGRKWSQYQMNKVINDIEQPLELKEQAKEVIFNYDLELIPDEKEDY